MAKCNGWIGDVFLCLLLPLVALSSDDGTAHDITCSDGAIRESRYMTYLGCYNLTCFEMKTSIAVDDIDQCTNECSNGVYSYAALFNETICSCGNFTCDRYDGVCAALCGIPCLGNVGDKFETCGGIGFFQLYENMTDPTELPDTRPRIIIPVIVCIVLMVAACLTCYIVGMYGRRRKRRHDRNQAETPIPPELTSRRPRPQSRENIYSIVGLSQHNPANISNGSYVSSISMSSESAYDHTSTLNRIQSSSQRHQGCNSLPRHLPSQSAPSRHNLPAMRKVTEGMDWGGDEEFNGFCCSESKYGRECRCRRGRREPGKPRSNRMAPHSKSNGGGQLVAACDNGSRRIDLDEDWKMQEGESANERKYAPEKMSGGRGRDRAHTESLKGRGRLLSSPYKEREMLALPCEKGAMENQHSRKDSRRASPINYGRLPVAPNIETEEDGGQNDSGAFYHTLDPGNESNPSTSANYFTLEPSDYSGESSVIRFAVEQNNDHRGLEDTPTCPGSADAEYDYAAFPGQSRLRNLPCSCKPKAKVNSPSKMEEKCEGMIDNILYHA